MNNNWGFFRVPMQDPSIMEYYLKIMSYKCCGIIS